MSTFVDDVTTEAAPDRAADRTAVWRTYVPLSLLGALLLLVGLFVATQAGAYGRTWDEGAQDWYGEAVYRWYVSRGTDLLFLQASAELQLPQHGPFFEFVVAAAQHAFDQADRWYVRSVVCGVTGALGIVGMALCGRELGGWWTAFLAAAGLALYPRYTGAVFNNSKDVPLAVAMIFLLWVTLRLAGRWWHGRHFLPDSVLVGVCLGAATAIRVNALLWCGVLALTAAVWWLRRGRAIRAAGGTRPAVARLAASGVLIGVSAYLTIIALWPYVAMHPVDGLVDSIRSMSKYGWYGSVLFEGEPVRGDQLPRRYAPQWLLIGSPLPTVALGFVGLCAVATDVVRRRLRDARVLLPVALFAVPLVTIVVLRPTLYNGLRHFLFLVPGLVLVGAIGLVRIVSALVAARRRVAAGAVIVATALTWAEVAVAASRLYPLEYMYFSPVVGGYAGARDSYEGDYWGACQTPALAWLVRNHRRYPTPQPPTLGGLFDEAVRMPAGFAAAAVPDFFITSVHYPLPPDYVPVHEIRVEGATLCSVNVHPAYAPR